MSSEPENDNQERKPEVYILIAAVCIVVWVLAATQAHAHQYDTNDMRTRASAAYIFWTFFIEWPAIFGTAIAGMKAVQSWKKSK